MMFKTFWKFNKGEEFTKADKLSQKELKEIQAKVEQMTRRGIPGSKVIKFLQKYNAKLAEKWKAERAYFTEASRARSDVVKDAAEELDVNKYKMLLSPHACKMCKDFTDNGKKIFTQKGLQKNGWDVPPIHPNCYCIVVPYVD